MEELREPGADLGGPGTNHLQVWKGNVWIFPDEVHCEERGIGGRVVVTEADQAWPDCDAP